MSSFAVPDTFGISCFPTTFSVKAFTTIGAKQLKILPLQA
jgi:hypothetical protein